MPEVSYSGLAVRVIRAAVAVAESMEQEMGQEEMVLLVAAVEVLEPAISMLLERAETVVTDV